ncbi:hypothetical protein O206_22545 [Ochrobactrum sp. EGD-AQ16]|nr:hypothetical protein O206_22545 [Ochrobactrum sp. EGD-AQ16]
MERNGMRISFTVAATQNGTGILMTDVYLTPTGCLGCESS